MVFGWTPFDQVMAGIAVIGTILALWGYISTHPRKKQK
jgi:hypothetical protein